MKESDRRKNEFLAALAHRLWKNRSPYQICDLVDLLPETLALCQQKISGKEIELNVALPDERLLVFADPVRLVQIFGKLPDSAAKFTGARGRIDVIAKAEGANALIAVRDNGVGLTPDQLSSAFELFRQMKRGKNRNSEGLGIGLSRARRLAELHGDEIVAQSKGEGRGRAFSVRLPLFFETADGCQDVFLA